MRAWMLFVASLALTAGCDLLFQIAPTPEPRPDARTVDARLPDAASVLTCTPDGIVLRPTTGVSLMWETEAPASSAVQDVADATPDDDATYIASMRDGASDLFGHLPIAESTSVDSVVIWARARAEQPPGFPEIGIAIVSGPATPYDDRVITTSYSDYSGRLYALDPATNMRWTVPGVNSMVFGVRKSYADVTARVTQVWAVVACH
jgi:hypothetical protein